MQLASVFDGAKEAMLVVDERGFILLFNQASERLFGRPAAQTIGTHVGSLMQPDTADKHGGDVPSYFGDAERASPVRFADKDGNDLPVDLSFSNAGSPGGAQYLLIARELRHQGGQQLSPEVTADLMRSARMAAIDEMSAAFTHKLNQPLTAALLYLQTIERIYGRETEWRSIARSRRLDSGESGSRNRAREQHASRHAPLP